MKTEVSVTSSLSRWRDAFRGRLTQLYLFAAAQLQTNRGMLFLHEGAWNGHDRWKPLRLRDGQPLKDRGTLSQSIGPIRRSDSGVRPAYNRGTIVSYGADKVTVGTSLKYARLMNDGGTIVPKKGKVLWIPLPSKTSATKEVNQAKKHGHLNGAPIVRLANGKFFMLAKKVKVPPRPFDKLNSKDQEELRTAMTNEVARCLNV